MWEAASIGLLLVLCIAAVALTALRLPGTWVVVTAALGYGWWSNWERFGTTLVVVLVVIAVAGEIVEFGMSMLIAKKAGASRRAMWGGFIGGMAGMILLASAFTVPLPILGTLIGAILGAVFGCFGGAMIGELTAGREFVQGARVGFFSALGFAMGTATKTAFALAMSGILFVTILSRSPEPVSDSPPPAITADLPNCL